MALSRIISIAFLCIICLKSIASSPASISNSHFKNCQLTDTGKVIISGTVKDESGNPLENAKVLFDTTQAALTDKDGRFSFEPAQITPTSHNIYISYDGFVTAVRSYYPVMLSADFDVRLRKQFGSTTVIKEPTHAAVINAVPGIVPKDSIHNIHKDTANNKPITNETIKPTVELDFPSILFTKDQIQLTGQDKAFLDIIVKKLNDNPTVSINIKAYTRETNNNPLTAKARLANITRYLTTHGIPANRLKKTIMPGGGDENTIDIESE